MGQGSIIGYEINEKTCQISFYNEKDLEPDTLEVDTDNYQIPLIIGKLRCSRIFSCICLNFFLALTFVFLDQDIIQSSIAPRFSLNSFPHTKFLITSVRVSVDRLFKIIF